MTSLKLVLVHLGEELPDYLIKNLFYLKKSFPKEEIYLIIDSMNHVHNPKLSEIELFQYKSNNLKLEESLNRISHTVIFRDGFWRKTIERIFAVTEFHKTFPDGSAILHIESDVLITPNFPLSKLNENTLPDLGWCPYSAEEDVAAILFSRNLQSSLELEKCLIELLSEDHSLTDMTALNRVKDRLGRRVFYFPLTPVTENIKASKTSETIQENLSEINEYFDLFGGVFDSLSVGMYTWGIDPRNTYGFTLIHNNSQSKAQRAYVIPEKQCVFLDSSDSLIYRISNKEFNLFATHIHSKNIGLFEKVGSREMKKLVTMKKSRHFYSFNIEIFLSLLKSNWHEKTLFNYLISPLRKRLRWLA